MTIVAVLFADTCPLIISDSLISAKDSNPEGVQTPLSNNEIRGGGDGYIPVGVARKVWDTGAQTLLLYSGVVNDAKELLLHLQHLTQYKTYDDNAHEDLVNRVAQDKLDVSFIVLTINSGEIEHYYYNANICDSLRATFGLVVCIGTGSDGFIKTLSKVHGVKLPPPAQATDYISTECLNSLNAASEMTLDYLNEHQSLFAQQSCGAYFEVIIPTILYPDPPSWMSNGFGHIFVEVVDGVPKLRKVVLSQPELACNTVLYNNAVMDLPFVGDEVCIPKELMVSHRIMNDRHDSCHDNLSENLPAVNISFLTVYGEIRGRSGINYYSRNCDVAVNGFLAKTEVSGAHFVLSFTDCNSIQKLVDRLLPLGNS